LQNENINISDICERVGFGNKPYFTTLFTKKYGISPTKFRQINKVFE